MDDYCLHFGVAKEGAPCGGISHFIDAIFYCYARQLNDDENILFNELAIQINDSLDQNKTESMLQNNISKVYVRPKVPYRE